MHAGAHTRTQPPTAELVVTCCMPIVVGVLVTVVLSSPLQGSSAGVSVSHREYVETVIRALSQAHDALAAVNAESSENILGKMTALKMGKIELDSAARSLAPFTTDRNENRKTASETLVTAFGMVVKSLDMQVSLYERLDGASSEDDLKGMRSVISDAAVMYKQASKLMLTAASVVVASAVVPDPADPDNHIALAMTAADKAALLKMLKTGFGGTLVNTIGDTGPATAAKLMLEGIGQDWRLAPEK